MKEVVEILIFSILKDPKITNSFLNNTKSWKRAHYIYLSEIIEFELKKTNLINEKKKIEIGTTISATTLKRIFEIDKNKVYTDDIRFIKTLDKLALFLGFQSLDDFIKKRTNPNFINSENTNKNIIKIDAKNSISESTLYNIIKDFCHIELDSIKRIPNFKMEEFYNVLDIQSPILKRITRNLNELSKQGYVYHKENNHSNYEIFNFKTIDIEEKTAIISTNEYWNLTLTNRNGTNTQIVNFSNEQVYFIKKINNTWKIWDNFNPYSDKIIENIKERSKL
ncbi:hypothetical protein AX766_09030 [Flavobacterium covae]|uniref:Uncharacterized protein n=1 Tax=Flavobacterium covae TaxID=2906076 RepID=A0ABW8PCJ9_9FLAO|nr:MULTISPECIES: hypothetical protein [Flavobacterium]OXA82351.1 hypothetical protein B0A56_04970 [Flavobacterium columnare NBRC 100251 = ATCC 23463]AND64547.1 hypothetical protein AX766_09030 [Flavobacterium covae]MCJ1807355.1 hypothetical protein [Flavobacterium covae]OWP80831.1 hypothetical protein BWK63_08760 [Flavobacterium covae]OWP86593.1 hypothetical protein BWK60_07990 [Flavobacterium covae]